MIRSLAVICIFTILHSVSAENCQNSFIRDEKNLRKMYILLRKKSRECTFSTLDYVRFGGRAILSGYSKEAYWAASRALKNSKENTIHYLNANLLKATALNDMRRNEEAIEILRPIALNSSKQSSIYQKIYLELIRAYYLKNDQKIDDNVLFLFAKFNNKFPKSRYSPLLSAWIKDAKTMF